MYAASPKKFDKAHEPEVPSIKSKVDFRRTQASLVKKWNHYDTNISNFLVEQRKIIRSKNYELDSRAWGLKDYGV